MLQHETKQSNKETNLSVFKKFEGLGLTDYFGNPKTVVVVEWGERLPKGLSYTQVRVNFKYLSDNKRQVFIE